MKRDKTWNFFKKQILFIYITSSWVIIIVVIIILIIIIIIIIIIITITTIIIINIYIYLYAYVYIYAIVCNIHYIAHVWSKKQPLSGVLQYNCLGKT